MAAAVVAAGFAVWHRRQPQRTSSISASLQVEKLTSRGSIGIAQISPDGRYIAYQHSEQSRHSIWLRDVEERTETRLVPPFAGTLWSLQFSRDGRSLYYLLEPSGRRGNALYRISLVGGEPRLIRDGMGSAHLSPGEKRLVFREINDFSGIVLVELDGAREKRIPGGRADPVAWSQDAGRFAFVRRQTDAEALFVADADGERERKVLEAPAQNWLSHAWFTPDGKRMVCGFDDRKQDQKRLFDVDLATGRARRLGDRTWEQIDAFHWLPDGSGFVVEEVAESGALLWLVSYPEGKAERIPRDTRRYRDASLTADGSRLLAVESVGRQDIVVSSSGARGPFQRVVAGTGVRFTFCWTPDRRIVYSSNEGGSYDLFVSDPDGGDRRQLTFDKAGNEQEPAASPDGRYVVFVSDRSGESELWRVDRDGTGLRQLTTVDPRGGHRLPDVSPDSREILYRHWEPGPTLWRMPIDGGPPVHVKGAHGAATPDQAFGGAWSPDGRSVAFFYSSAESIRSRWGGTDIAIAALDGRIHKRFRRSEDVIGNDERLRWSRDGRALYYRLRKDGVVNLWRQDVAGGPPEQVTYFEEGVGQFDWSLDGRSLACSRGSRLSDAVLITNFR